MVEADAFMWCVKLKHAVFPETLESVGKWAFDGCDMNSVVFPASLIELGERSFCIMNLKSVYCKSETPPLCLEGDQGGPFVDVWLEDADAKLYVPIGCKELYAAQWQWSIFKEIIETDEFPTSGVEAVMPGNTAACGRMFDLYGREIATPAPGQIYIQDGKKKVALR